VPEKESHVAKRLSNLDSSFLFMESAANPMHGGPIFFLKGELPYEKLLAHMEERLRTAPRFRQRLAFGRSTWRTPPSRMTPISKSKITFTTIGSHPVRARAKQ